MFTFVTFIVSLILIITLLVIKNLEISRGTSFASTRLFSRFDLLIAKILEHIKIGLSQMNFENLQLIFSKIIVNMGSMIKSFKRRFDHKQSHFFTKRDIDPSKHKGAVSFFLKDISEHKKTLRENNKEV